MEKRKRKDFTLSDLAVESIRDIIGLAGKAGFPNVDKFSHVVDLAVIEFCEQLKQHVTKGQEFPFVTINKWQQK